MSYFNHDLGGQEAYRKSVENNPVWRVLCDKCAQSEIDVNLRARVKSGWNWAPSVGTPCHACGKPA